MRRLLLLFALLVIACSRESRNTATEPIDTRESIAVMHVTAPDGLEVRAKANDAAPVVATYQNGEAVSIVAKNGEWAEIRTGDRTGWARLSELGAAADAAQQEENPQVRFRKMPQAVLNTTAHGDVYLEASVNTDGDVTDVRLISNSTGSEPLAIQNAAALREAKFYPIVKSGGRQPFKYYHRVTY